MAQLPPIIESLTGIKFERLLEQVPALKKAMETTPELPRKTTNGCSASIERTMLMLAIHTGGMLGLLFGAVGLLFAAPGLRILALDADPRHHEQGAERHGEDRVGPGDYLPARSSAR